MGWLIIPELNQILIKIISPVSFLVPLILRSTDVLKQRKLNKWSEFCGPTLSFVNRYWPLDYLWNNRLRSSLTFHSGLQQKFLMTPVVQPVFDALFTVNRSPRDQQFLINYVNRNFLKKSFLLGPRRGGVISHVLIKSVVWFSLTPFVV